MREEQKPRENHFRHPEQEPDELFLGNWPLDAFRGGKPNGVGWTQIRIGMKAYDIHGKWLRGTCPVFVKVSEVPEEIRTSLEWFVSQGVDHENHTT